MKITLNPEKFYLIGNNLALDFINSINHELTREGLLSWAVAVAVVKPAEAEDYYEKWNGKRLDEISIFRKRLRRAVVNLVSTKQIPASEISWLNRVLRENAGYSELAVSEQGFTKTLKIDLCNPDSLIGPITESFVDLICFGQLDYLRKCERADCILYFYDTTKNHRRRWCSMAICGNRAKAAKFYKRKMSGT